MELKLTDSVLKQLAGYGDNDPVDIKHEL